MVSAARTAVKLEMLGLDDQKRIENLVLNFGLPVKIDRLSPADVIESMRHDKKVLAGQVRLILPEALGKVTILNGIPEEILKEVLLNQLGED